METILNFIITIFKSIKLRSLIVWLVIAIPVYFYLGTFLAIFIWLSAYISDHFAYDNY